MNISPSSSSRTLTGRGGNGDDRDPLAPLKKISFPDLDLQSTELDEKGFGLTHSGYVFSELKEDSPTGSPSNPTLSTGTLKLFCSNSSFNCSSEYVDDLLNLDALAKYCGPL